MLEAQKRMVGRTPDGGFGASVAACLFGFVAGAPGSNELFTTAQLQQGIRWETLDAGGGAAGALVVDVACYANQSVAVGAAGIWLIPAERAVEHGGYVDPLTNIAMEPMARLPRILVGDSMRDVWLLESPTASHWTVAAPESTGFGVSVAWVPGQEAFYAGHAGDPLSAKPPSVAFYRLTDAGDPDFDFTVTPSSVTYDMGFPHALAVGNLSPSPGLELIASAPGLQTIFVFGADGGLLWTIDDADGGAVAPSFGRSVAVDPGDAAGGIQAYWVGDPAHDRVVRYVGTQPTDVLTPKIPAPGFGEALDIGDQGAMVIGAPQFKDFTGAEVGAVFGAFAPKTNTVGVAMDCTTGLPCAVGQCEGTCVGGVLCAGPVDQICATDGGWVPAPTPDAGALDAGAEDAGAHGDADGGLPGPATFKTSGCSSAATGPATWAWLGMGALAVLRRRSTSR